MVGATDYLAKPFGEEELVTIVEKYVGLGRPESPNSSQSVEMDPEEEPWPEI